MKRLNVSDSELRLIIIFIAVCVLAAAYFFGFNTFTEKAKLIEEANVVSEQRLMQLQSMAARRVQIEEEITKYNQFIEDTIAKYPVDVPTEKSIYHLQNMEDSVGAHFSAINFLMDTRLTALSGQITDETVEVTGPVAYYNTLTMSYDASYDDLKDMVDYIHNFDDRMTIPSITAAYDSETGNISGVINVRMYYLTETNKEYEQVPDTGIRHGVSNIFGGE